MEVTYTGKKPPRPQVEDSDDKLTTRTQTQLVGTRRLKIKTHETPPCCLTTNWKVMLPATLTPNVTFKNHGQPGRWI